MSGEFVRFAGPREASLREVRAPRSMSRVSSLALCVVIAGCAPSAPAGIFLPTYEPMDTLPAALLQGTLIEEDGCLWIESDNSRWLVLWPDATYASVEDDQLVVYSGGDRAVVGARVSAGGGEYGAQDEAFVADLIGEAVPAACQQSGLYWLGGGIRSVTP